MSPHQLASVQALGRVAVGATMTVAPALLQTWLGPSALKGPTQVAVRALGIRDLSLGVGTLLALRAGSGARTWIALGAVCDLVDGAATIAAREELSGAAVAAAGAIAFGSAGLATYLQSAAG